MNQEKLTLKIEKREPKQKSVGKLPAVLYGPKIESTSIFVDMKQFKKVWKEAGESTVIKLSKSDFDSKLPKSDFNVLIQEVQLDPLTSEPIHADFYAVDMTKEITAKIPLEFKGEAPAIKLGGVLVKVIHELEVEAMPKDLPPELKVDVSKLETFDDKITVGDLFVPSAVKVKNDLEDAVAFVEEVKEVEEPEDQRTIEDVEVTTEKKSEEDKDKKEGEEKVEEKSEKEKE